MQNNSNSINNIRNGTDSMSSFLSNESSEVNVADTFISTSSGFTIKFNYEHDKKATDISEGKCFANIFYQINQNFIVHLFSVRAVIRLTNITCIACKKNQIYISYIFSFILQNRKLPIKYASK